MTHSSMNFYYLYFVCTLILNLNSTFCGLEDCVFQDGCVCVCVCVCVCGLAGVLFIDVLN